MFSWTELQSQSSLDQHGTVEINTTYVTSRKPLWLVALKLVVLVGMVALGSAILIPLLGCCLPVWNAVLVNFGIMLIYIGIAFFFRPTYNGDNMGWFGGMANDPFQYSDNINRFLFQLHMLLGPGRFAAETLLDACAVAGLVQGAEVVEESEPAIAVTESAWHGSHDQPASVSPTFAHEPRQAGRLEDPKVPQAWQ